MKRVRDQTVAAAFGGLLCKAQYEVQDCNIQACPAHCIPDTAVWSSCSKTCGGGTQQQPLKYSGLHHVYAKACPAMRERTCNSQACPVSCRLSGWSNYGLCSMTCGSGLQSRSRSIIVLSSHGGVACGMLGASASCNTHKCPVDCTMGKWSLVSSCTKTCGSGIEARHRVILKTAEHGGQACTTLTETAKCNAQACPVDCVMGNWGQFTICSSSCGGGISRRMRAAQIAATFGGLPCGLLQDVQNCNTGPCLISQRCVVSEWSAWGGCSGQCGGGLSSRTRGIIFGTDHCPSLTSYRPCNTNPCPANCEHEWGVWGACSASCGGGSTIRNIMVFQEPARGGRACPTSQQRLCNNHACPARLPTAKPTPSPSMMPTGPPSPAPLMRPVIQINGDDIITVEATKFGKYKDEGATCSDSFDGMLNAKTHFIINPDVSTPKVYDGLYTCVNRHGVMAIPAKKVVIIRDSTCPKCELNKGPATVEASFPYTDPGAACADSLDGQKENIEVTGSVDVEATGMYRITYRVRDKAGNWNDGRCTGSKAYVRKVKVVDTLRPVIKIKYGDKVLHVGASADTGANGETNPAPAYFPRLMAEGASGSWNPVGALAAIATGLALFVQVRHRRHRRGSPPV